MRDARKLFRLAKTLNEIQKIIELITKADSSDEITLYLNILQRLSFGAYWIFDNIVVLCSIKFLKRDSKAYNKAGMTFWFLALIFGLIQTFRDLSIAQKKLAKVNQSILLAKVFII